MPETPATTTPDEPAAGVDLADPDGQETPDAAARRLAGELERLKAGVAAALDHAGIPAEELTTAVPADEWPVTAAIGLLSAQAARIETLEQEVYAAHHLLEGLRFPTMGEVPAAPADAPGELTDEQRIDLAAVTPALEPVRDALDAVPSTGLLADMARIAQGFRGVAYDSQDRPTEQLAVRRAAVAHGLIPVPDESLFRTYRGCTPPVPPLTPQVLVQSAAAVVTPPRQAAPTDPIEIKLEVTAAAARGLLEQLAATVQARK